MNHESYMYVFNAIFLRDLNIKASLHLEATYNTQSRAFEENSHMHSWEVFPVF